MWEWKTCQFGWSHCENQSENSGISCSRGSGPESGGLSWAENSLEVDDQVWTWQDGQGLERPQPFITEGGGMSRKSGRWSQEPKEEATFRISSDNRAGQLANRSPGRDRAVCSGRGPSGGDPHTLEGSQRRTCIVTLPQSNLFLLGSSLCPG